MLSVLRYMVIVAENLFRYVFYFFYWYICVNIFDIERTNLVF
jgi:hypothetical protein